MAFRARSKRDAVGSFCETQVLTVDLIYDRVLSCDNFDHPMSYRCRISDMQLTFFFSSEQ